VRDAAARARAGGGATFIEAQTYRAGPHTTSDDPTKYRAGIDFERWPDPPERFRSFLERAGMWDADREALLEAELADELERAVEEVEAEPPPDPRTLIEGVFARTPAFLEEELEELLRPRR
jgi:TPP-dependent pyruvate/acetoin dehydrogenase alpha subunit